VNVRQLVVDLFLAVILGVAWLWLTKSVTVLLLNLVVVTAAAAGSPHASWRERLQAALIASTFIATVNAYAHFP